MTRSLTIVALAGMAVVATAGDLVSNRSANPSVPQLNARTLTKSNVASPAGGFWSEAQNDTGNLTVSNTNAGYSCNSNTGTAGTTFRLADDFVVTTGWELSSVKVYGYRTGLPGLITGGNLKIWNGRPGDLGSVVLYDSGAQAAAITDIINASPTTSGRIFRIFNTVAPAPGTAPGTTRKIEQITLPVNPPLLLAPGTYWVDCILDPAAAGTLFTPPTVHEGVRAVAGCNGRQYLNASSTWTDMVDAGNPATPPSVNQDLPFIVTGRGKLIGVVNLQGWGASPAGITATVEIRNVGSLSPLQTEVVTLDAAGGYTFLLNAATSNGGNFDVAVKPSCKWVRRTTSHAIPAAGTTVTHFLRTGDVDGDNEVAVGDYAIISSSFGKFLGDPGYQACADLDGDDEIAIGDYSLMSTNFGLFGDD